MKIIIVVLLYELMPIILGNKSDWSKIKFRIIGGSESKPHSQPYQAAIFFNTNVFCGGSLISTKYVLTAAHCIRDAQRARVILGAHNIQRKESTQVEFTSTKFKMHENYNPSTSENDIGLIELPKAAPLNANIKIIKLAKSGNFARQKALLSGWGRTSTNGKTSPVLNSVELTVMTNGECAQILKSLIKNTMLCTEGSSANRPKGICSGDSGGPLVLRNEQIGVVSFNKYKCESGSPSVFTRVTSYADWITKNTGIKI